MAFLSDGAAYGLPGAEVERIETHCSLVFLVADRAYKLKRPVAFSSLDYTTVARREAACRAELALNRRTAPELYLDVLAIRRKAGGELVLGGEGAPLDWLVVMRRFDQADLFDHLAATRRLTPELIGALAEEIAAFHALAEPVAGFGGAAGLRGAIERNRLDQRTVEGVLGRDAIEALRRESLVAVERVAPLLDRRREAGKVRRCHGDLRLANLCLLGGRPTLFDAVEFCDEVACIDVLFDLAFLLMDLCQHGLETLANHLFNRYLDVTGDDDGLAALPPMLSLRAATRAYALAASVARQHRAGEAQHHAASARSHLALAAALLAAAPPRLVALGGVAGSAKTALAYSLAASFQPAPGARVLRSAVARRRLLALPPEARPTAAAYDAATTERVYAGLAGAARQALQARVTAVIDASFVRPEQREAVAETARRAGVPFVGLWLGAPADLAPGGEGWHALKPGPGGATMLATARLLAHAGDAVPRQGD